MKNKEKIYFVKTRNVKTPTRGTAVASGIDFFMPEFDEQFLTDLQAKNPNLFLVKNAEGKVEKIHVGKDILIPSGIKVKIPHGWALCAHNKSGVATKKKMIYGAELIDEDYAGEMHLHLINLNGISVELEPGEKLLQFVLEEQNYADMIEVYQDELNKLHENSERGEKGFGSTGTK